MFSVFKSILSLIQVTDIPTCNEQPLDTYKFAVQGNKCTLTIC
jgi:hypothetical protein